MVHVNQYFISGQITRYLSASIGGRRQSLLHCCYFKITKDKDVCVKQFIKLPCLTQAHIILRSQECAKFFLENTALRVLAMRSHTSGCKQQSYSRTNFPFLPHENFLQRKKDKTPQHHAFTSAIKHHGEFTDLASILLAKIMTVSLVFIVPPQVLLRP